MFNWFTNNQIKWNEDKYYVLLSTDEILQVKIGAALVSLDRVLFAAELEFPKKLVPRLPQNSSNANVECAEKLKQQYSLCDQLLGALIYLHFIIRTLISF